MLTIRTSDPTFLAWYDLTTCYVDILHSSLPLEVPSQSTLNCTLSHIKSLSPTASTVSPVHGSRSTHTNIELQTDETNGESEEDRRKAEKKAKKMEAKAKAAAEEAKKLLSKASGQNKSKEDEDEIAKDTDQDPNGEKLWKTTTPLKDVEPFLKHLESLGQDQVEALALVSEVCIQRGEKHDIGAQEENHSPEPRLIPPNCIIDRRVPSRAASYSTPEEHCTRVTCHALANSTVCSEFASIQ